MTSPGYTCISKRSKTVQVKYRNKSRGTIRHIAIDSTGLKVFGEGEWKVKKHGAEKRRTWRKLHQSGRYELYENVALSYREIQWEHHISDTMGYDKWQSKNGEAG